MTATRLFLVLFSLFALALNTAGQFCLLETAGATGVIQSGTAASTAFAAGSLTTVSGVYIETAGAGAGKLWVVAKGLHQVLRYPTATDFVLGTAAEAVLGTSGSTGTTNVLLNSPTAITTDSTGSCWITDTSNDRILIVTGCNTASSPIQATFEIGATDINTPGTPVSGATTPTGISCDNAAAVTPSNPVFVAQVSTGDIYAYTAPITADDPMATNAFLIFGTGTAATTSTSTTQLMAPLGIRFFKAANVLFVADSTANRVVRIAIPVPVTTTVIGTSTIIGTGTGTCATANIGNPSGVGIDENNSAIFVAATGNNAIIYVPTATTTPGTFSTFFPTTTGCGTGTGQNALNAPQDVDAVSFTTGTVTQPTVIVADTGNSRVLKLCGNSISTSFSMTGSLTLVSASFTASFSGGTASGTGSLSLNVAGSTASGTLSIAVTPTNLVSTSNTNSGSFSITTSFTTSFTNSGTISGTISRSLSITNSISISITISTSVSPSYSSSYTTSYSTSVSTSYSTSAAIYCGDGIVNGKEKCDAGSLNGAKTSCCKNNCRLRRGGRVCEKQSNPCLTNRRCDGRGNCRDADIRADAPCVLSTGLSGRCNGEGVCTA